jgi:hypothetical protein
MHFEIGDFSARRTAQPTPRNEETPVAKCELVFEHLPQQMPPLRDDLLGRF